MMENDGDSRDRGSLPVGTGDFACRVDLPGDWINLTLNEGTKEEAGALALRAVKQWNPLHLVTPERSLVKDMTQKSLRAYADDVIMAAFCYSQEGTPLADLRIDSYGEEGAFRPSSEEIEEMLTQWPNAEIAGTPEVTREVLSKMEIIRVQSVIKRKRILGIGRQLSEVVKYAFLPHGVQDVIVLTITWGAFAKSEEFTTVADEIAASLHFVPLGNG